jgi:hypothetical protein
MSALEVSLIAFACTFSAALAETALHTRLPYHHLDGDSKEVVRLVMGLIGTLSALVLGLPIASASRSFDAQTKELRTLSAQVLQVDRLLSVYGTRAQEVRDLFRQNVHQAHDRVWLAEGSIQSYSIRSGPASNRCVCCTC